MRLARIVLLSVHAASMAVGSAAQTAVERPHRPWVLPGEYLVQSAGLPLAESLDLLAEGHTRFPDYPPLARAYGTRLLFAGRFSDAEQVFLACGEAEPEEAFPSCRMRCQLGLAVALLHLSRPDDVAPMLEDLAVRPDADGWRARLYVARGALDQGNLERAVASIRSLRPSPSKEDEALLLTEEARIAWVEGNANVALAFLVAAANAHSRAGLYLLQALVLAWSGDTAAANQALTKVQTHSLPLYERRLPKLLSLALRGHSDTDLEQEHLRQYPGEASGWLVAVLGAWMRGERALAAELLDQGRQATGSPLLRHHPPLAIKLGG